MKIAYIYLGKSDLPGYVVENLANTRAKFPQNEIVFISDNPESLECVSKIGICVWRCSNQATKNSSVLNSMNHPMNFRSGFWFSTLARFFALEEYMESTLESEVLQIEADVWLSTAFPFKKFRSLTTELAYPIESVGRGAASVLYIGSIRAIKDFNNYCKEELKMSPNSTDMTLLGSYAETHSDRVVQLPTAPDPSFFKEFVPNHISSDGCSSYSHFEGIFDPLTYGMHLFGVDAKNNRGFLKLFTDPDHHILAMRELDFKLINNELFVRKNNKTSIIFNLHIHSKNLKIFKNESAVGEISRLLSMRRDHEVNRIIWRVLWSSIGGKMKKWVKGTKFNS